MNKMKTYLGYLFEYLKHGDFLSVIASFNYLIRKKSHGNERIIQSRIGKFFCRPNTNDFQFANYKYEWAVKKFILKQISNFNIFIDAGACVGTYSILAEKKGVRCFAFEPVSDNYRILNTNLKLNHLQNVIQIFPFGLGDSNKRVKFAINPVNTGASHICDDSTSQYTEQVEIRIFDSLLAQIGLKISDQILFKLDVEGMEMEALKGASDFIKRYPNILFIIETKHSDRNQIIKLLGSMAVFETGIIDSYNIFARKISNIHI